MTPRTCFAFADTPRAIVALLAPIGLIAAIIMALASKGYSLLDYFNLLASGAVPWLGQGVAWLALGVWIVRYFPPALVALWDGPCIVSSDGKDLFLPRGHKVSLSTISAVTLHRGFFRKVACFERSQGRIVVSLLFVRPSSDPLLRSLAASDKAFA